MYAAVIDEESCFIPIPQTYGFEVTSYPLLYNTILLPGFNVFIFKIGIIISAVSVSGFFVYSSLGADQPLRHGRLRHEEGPRDLRGGQARPAAAA